MLTKSLIVFAFAPALALDVNQKLLRGTTLANGRKCNLGRMATVCTQHNVSVLEVFNSNGMWERSLQFGSECATESTIVCKHSEACSSNSCDVACPCDVDMSAGLSEPYMQTMFEQLGPKCSEDSARVLMLGLGGGELTQYLLHHCRGMHVDAVELNADVISLARAYFGLRESEEKFAGRLTIEHADALTAVKGRALAADEGYDAVLVDCFSGGGEVPESCRSDDFAKKVNDVLKPGGVMLQNIWHYSKMNEQVSHEFEDTKAIYHKVFDVLDDVLVPMPPRIRWVDILKATKKDEDLGETLARFMKK